MAEIQDFTYNLSTDIGKVRALIPDKDEERFLFSDQELEILLDRGKLRNNSYKIEWAVYYAWLELASESNQKDSNAGVKFKLHRLEIYNDAIGSNSPYNWLKQAEELRKTLERFEALGGAIGSSTVFFGGLSLAESDIYDQDIDNLSSQLTLESMDNKKSWP